MQKFARRIGELFPGCPCDDQDLIAEHACRKYSGRVGRSAAAKELDSEAVQLAVRAHVRHVHTRIRRAPRARRLASRRSRSSSRRCIGVARALEAHLARMPEDAKLDAAQVTSILQSQFSDLAPARVVFLGEGCDSFAFEVNDDWVFRFPKRDDVARQLAIESRVLPVLAARSPLRLPVFSFHGRPSDAFPFPFAGYRKIPVCQPF